MQFLSPWYIPALAAVLTVPPLVIMYFLRLRRRETPVPTTYLWRKVIEDLQVNQPFQKLRKNLLLLLQLLVLAAAVFALAKPIHKVAMSQDERIVLLIDRSGSMSVREGRSTRLEQAKDQAQSLLRGMRRSQKVMLVAFADTAEVISPFTADKGMVAERIRSIQPSDRTTQLDEAIRLAKAYATPLAGPEGDGPRNQMVSTEPPGKAIIFSDGAISDSSQISPGRLNLEYVKIGSADNNIGITAIEARREYANPQQIQLFLRIQNFSPKESARTGVSIYINDTLAAAKDLDLPAHAVSRRKRHRGKRFAAGRPHGQFPDRCLRPDQQRCRGDRGAAAGRRRPQGRQHGEGVPWAGQTVQRAPGHARQHLPGKGAGRPAAAPSGADETRAIRKSPREGSGLRCDDLRRVRPRTNSGTAISSSLRRSRRSRGSRIQSPPKDAPADDDTWRGTIVDFDTMHPMIRHVSVDEILVARWSKLASTQGCQRAFGNRTRGRASLTCPRPAGQIVPRRVPADRLDLAPAGGVPGLHV